MMNLLKSGKILLVLVFLVVGFCHEVEGQLPYTPDPSAFDNYYNASGTYYHKQQQIYGKCGPMAYVVARKMRNPSYPYAYSNINTIYNKYASGGVSLGELYYYDDDTDKSLLSKPAGNNQWGNGRTELKNFIKARLSQGKVILMPTEYNMSSGSVGHFYVLVELFLTDVGTGSIVGVKDVYVPSSETKYFDYTAFLDSNWRNSSSNSANRHYNAVAFE